MNPEIESNPQPAEEQRYGVLETGDGDMVIYDREEPSAWLQSDKTVELEV